MLNFEDDGVVLEKLVFASELLPLHGLESRDGH